MWESVVDKLKQLKGIDRQCQAFGAETHRYVLRLCLSADAADTVERLMGIALPPLLRSFYIVAGDGVAGPNYGVKPASKLSGWRPREDYPGIEVFRQIASSEGTPPDERGYFEVDRDALAGLLPIIEEGCGHEVCLISNDPRAGNVVYVSADGYVNETQNTLIEIYTDWLNGEIERFESVRSLMAAGKSFEQIENEMIARFQEHNAGDRITSIADVPKPAALFGEGNHRIYHGATQRPWYESVLKDWQRRNL